MPLISTMSRRGMDRLWVVVGALLTGVALGSISGCVSTESLEAPDVTLVNLELVDATLFESTLDIELRIANLNPEPMVLDGAVIKLELNGTKVGKGAGGERLEIPRFDSVVTGVRVHLNHLALATRIKGIIDTEVVEYSISGKVRVVRPSGRVVGVPIGGRGSLALSGGSGSDSGSLPALPAG